MGVGREGERERQRQRLCWDEREKWQSERVQPEMWR